MKKVGRMDNAVCPRCGEEEDTPDYIVFRCKDIKGIKDVKGRRRRLGGSVFFFFFSWYGVAVQAPPVQPPKQKQKSSPHTQVWQHRQIG